MTYIEQIRLNQQMALVRSDKFKRPPLIVNSSVNCVTVFAPDSMCKVHLSIHLKNQPQKTFLSIIGPLETSFTSRSDYYSTLLPEDFVDQFIKDETVYQSVMPSSTGLHFQFKVFNAMNEGNLKNLLVEALRSALESLKVEGYQLRNLFEGSQVPRFYFYAYVCDKFVLNPTRILSQIRQGNVGFFYCKIHKTIKDLDIKFKNQGVRWNHLVQLFESIE